MKRNLLIVGAGQYGQVAKETAEAMGIFSKISFLDDYSPNAVGKISEYERFVKDYPNAFVAIGNSSFRFEMLNKLKKVGFLLPVLINPRAYVSPSATVNEGCIIEPMAVVNSNVILKRGVFVCAGSVVNHNAIIEECAQIDCGAVVSANGAVSSMEKINYNDVKKSTE